MRGEFRRSSRFGLIGVLVVAAITVVIGLSAGNDADPKLQYGLIFGVLAVFLVGLFYFQRRDMTRAAAGDVKGFSKGPQEVDDPTRLGDGELWAALAVRPIDDDAIKARKEMWGAGFRSMKLGMVIVVLIFLTVPPVYLLDTFVPLLIGVPLIVLAALYGSWRAIGSGGEVDSAYENMDRAMRPLGLSVAERPEVRMVPRAPSMPGYSARLLGPTVMTGERHGHRVEVRQEQGVSEVSLRAAGPKLDGKPTEVVPGLPASERWRNVKVHSTSGEILVRRKGDPGAWLCDLWLAERLAAQR